MKPCTKNYNDGGAHTATVIDGVACCVACGQPIANHGKKKGKS